MRKILIIVFSDIEKDIRVRRQIDTLKDEYNLTIVSYTNTDIYGSKFIKVNQPEKRKTILQKIKYYLPLLLGMYQYHYWDKKNTIIRDKLRKKKYDLIIANDIDTLPLALIIAKKKKVIFDAHEYYPRQFEDNLIWKIFFQRYIKYLCKRYIKKAHLHLTVNEGLADEYRKEYKILPIVIDNASDYHDIKPRNVNSNVIKIIHHGSAITSRKLENMIDMMDYIDNRFTLDLMLIKSEYKYYEYLKRIISLKSNINLIEPVPFEKLIDELNRYDIGLYILEPTNFNTRNALPNKLFDFIQARLAIAIGPSPEMSRIVKKYKLGIVSTDFSGKSMANVINGLTKEKIEYYKSMSNKNAYNLSSLKNKVKLINIVRKAFVTNSNKTGSISL